MSPPPRAVRRGYSPDLAFIHDAGYADFAGAAAPAIRRLLREAGLKRGLVVDVGCGSGVLASSLVRDGYDVLGLDISRSMIRLARARAPRARFRAISWTRAALPPCRAIVSIGESLSYRFDRAAGEGALKRFFVRARAALEPGGLLILDVLVKIPPGAPLSWIAGRSGRNWAVLSATHVGARGRVLRRRITSFRREGAGYRRTDEVHDLVLFDRRTLIASLGAAGFAVRTFCAYGPTRFAPHHLGFVARAR